MLETLFDYFLKWLIPFACAGLFTIAVVPLVSKYKMGKEKVAQEVWNAHAKELKQEVEQFKSEQSQKNAELEQQICAVEENLMSKIEENTSGVREAVLAMHLQTLITKSKQFITQKYISVDDLENYDEQVEVYKKLGGNGQLTPWASKVQKLPNEPPEKKV